MTKSCTSSVGCEGKRLEKDRCWTSVHDRYIRQEVLGEGTYGVVFRAENIETGQRVAMKRSRIDVYPEEGVPATALREVALLRDFRNCPNIMQMHEISCNASRLYMVCEFLDYDLKKFLKAHDKSIPYETVRSICREVLKGLAWCHGNRVMHRDLKPHNILLDKDATVVKLADFGLARAAHAPGKTITHEVITLWYRPPELLMGDCNYSDAVDIWSIGCIMAELFTGHPLFMGDCEIDTLFRIFRLLGTPTVDVWPKLAELPEGQNGTNWPPFPGHTDPFGSLHTELDSDGIDLLSKMLCYDPEKRISAIDALNHPWFNTATSRVSEGSTNRHTAKATARAVRSFPPTGLTSCARKSDVFGSSGRSKCSTTGSVSDLIDAQELQPQGRPLKRQHVGQSKPAF